MAKAINNEMATFLKMAAVLSILLFVTLAEGRSILGIGNFHQKAAESTPACFQVVSVQSGDTCLAIAKTFKLSTQFFGAINPNLNCNALFVGQWLCVNGE